MIASRIIERACRDCGQLFDAEELTASLMGQEFKLAVVRCEHCLREYEQAREDQEETREQKWNKLCDPIYRDFDMMKLPEESRQLANRVFHWQFGPRGIGLAGPSRIGKTFIITELFNRWHESGKSVKMLLATDLALAVGSVEDRRRERMIDECVGVDMLFIDDLAKAKMTERVETDLFHIIEQRRRKMRPVFATLNGSGKTLASMLSEEGGNALVNRLRYDVCEFLRIREQEK